jgi:hypothetical protein
MIIGTGTLGLNSLTYQKSNSVHSDLNADYGEWTGVLIAPIDPKIVDEIKRDHPSSLKVFINPAELDPYEFPLVIQVHQATEHYSSVEVYLQPTFVSEPTNSQSSDQSSNSIPIITTTPMPPSPTVPPPPKDQTLVTLCHKPDGPNEKTIYVRQAVVENHLAHGDYVGPCSIQ